MDTHTFDTAIQRMTCLTPDMVFEAITVGRVLTNAGRKALHDRLKPIHDDLVRNRVQAGELADEGLQLVSRYRKEVLPKWRNASESILREKDAAAAEQSMTNI